MGSDVSYPFWFPRLFAPARGWVVPVVALLAARLFSAAALAQPIRPPMAFFPPTPPVFGDTIGATTAVAVGRWHIPAPDGLGDFVAAPFYPMLGTRLLLDSHVLAKLQPRLDAFRATREALTDELLGELAEVEQLDEATRDRRLAELAVRQSPRIVALEAEADSLREDLIKGRIWESGMHWSRERSWRIGTTRFPSDLYLKEAEFEVLRAAAYYEPGLSQEQRGLLREIAIDLENKARASRRPDPRAGNDEVFAIFFSPETARLRLPKGLPEDLLKKIGRFNHDKAELKQELRETVLQMDAASASKREAAFEKLAEQQWPRIEMLAELAEDIRREFARLPPPPPLNAPPRIPKELMARIDRYESDRRMLTAQQNSHVFAAVAEVMRPPSGMDLAARREWLENMPSRRAEAMRNATVEFQRTHRDRFIELQERFAAIKDDLSVIASSYIDPQTGLPMTAESLQRSYNAAIQRFDAFGREEVIYKTYKIAMLTPGFSPEQRRLLFGVALTGLAQPLPPGEPLPTGRFPMLRR